MSSKRPLLAWLALNGCSMFALALIFGGPLALAKGYGPIGIAIHEVFRPLCHQLPERSFSIAGQPLPVCARCTGLYIGFAAMALLYPLVRILRETEMPERKWLFLAATPLVIDFSLGFLGVWENTHWSRFTTAAVLGAVAVIYVMPGLATLALYYSLPRFPQEQVESRFLRVSTDGLASGPSDYTPPHFIKPYDLK